LKRKYLKKGLKREQTKDLKGGGEPDQQEEENPINRRRRTLTVNP
jgi:hypothetical protein